MKSLLAAMGVQQEAVAPAVSAFVKSTYYTVVGLGSVILLQMATNGALESWSKALLWLKTNLWTFVVAQVLVPALRAHAAVNLYSVPGPASKDPKQT